MFILGATPRIFWTTNYKFAKTKGWVYSTYCTLCMCKVKFILDIIIFKFSFTCNNVTYKMWQHTAWEPLGYRRSPIYAPFLASPNTLNWWTAPLIYIFFMYDGVVYTDGGQKPLNVTLKRLGHKASRWVANMRRHDRCRMFLVGQLSDNWCCAILCGNWGSFVHPMTGSLVLFGPLHANPTRIWSMCL
jgi:hypothetical protein